MQSQKLSHQKISHQKLVGQLIESANSVILGKESRIKLAMATIFANGHLLLNDLPGVGKTTLANLLAKLFGLDFQRIQFTSDLLPADITGVSIFNQQTREFEFHSGPIFGQMILADEINRATPKTQSALLEAMEERQVSVERKTYILPKPFFVIATQNPNEQAGTFPLPESQLDRFMTSMDIGYPDHSSERLMLQNENPREKLGEIKPVVDISTLHEIQQAVANMHCSDALLDYLQAIIHFTRNSDQFTSGYSPRAAMALLALARSWSFIAGRKSVIPEDLQAVLPATVHHLRAVAGKINALEDILKRVAIP